MCSVLPFAQHKQSRVKVAILWLPKLLHSSECCKKYCVAGVVHRHGQHISLQMSGILGDVLDVFSSEWLQIKSKSKQLLDSANKMLWNYLTTMHNLINQWRGSKWWLFFSLSWAVATVRICWILKIYAFKGCCCDIRELACTQCGILTFSVRYHWLPDWHRTDC